MAGEYIRRAQEIIMELGKQAAAADDADLVRDGRANLKMQSFDTGATRSADEHKYDFEGFLSPAVLERFGEYMHKHRHQRDGQLRASDNWQKGIPIHKYFKSLVRHTIDLWRAYRGSTVVDKDTGQIMSMMDILMAIMFNVQGMTHEMLKIQGHNDVTNFCDHTRKAIEEGRPFSFYCPKEAGFKGEPGGYIKYNPLDRTPEQILTATHERAMQEQRRAAREAEAKSYGNRSMNDVLG